MKQHGNRDPIDTNAPSLRHRQPPIPSSSKHSAHCNYDWLYLDGNNGITEISGEAGTGKTQIGLSLCVATALSRLNAEVNVKVDASIDTSSSTNAKTGHCTSTSTSMNFAKARNIHKQSNTPLRPTKTKAASNITNPYQKNHVQSSVPSSASFSSSSLEEQQYYESMYISMGETTSPAQVAHRLHQMVLQRIDGNIHQTRHQSHKQNGRGRGLGGTDVSTSKRMCIEVGEENAQHVMRRIHTRFIRNEEEFMEFLNALPSHLQKMEDLTTSASISTSQFENRSKSRIGLIVLDSIAGLFRTPDGDLHGGHSPSGSGNSKARRTNYENDVTWNQHEKHDIVRTNRPKSFYVQRSETLFLIASKLKYISDKYGVHVVVVNQVTGKGGDHVIPSLGLSWSHCVNDRYLLSRKECGKNGSECGITKFERSIRVLASSSKRHDLQEKFCIQAIGATLS